MGCGGHNLKIKVMLLLSNVGVLSEVIAKVPEVEGSAVGDSLLHSCLWFCAVFIHRVRVSAVVHARITVFSLFALAILVC